MYLNYQPIQVYQSIASDRSREIDETLAKLKADPNRAVPKLPPLTTEMINQVNARDYTKCISVNNGKVTIDKENIDRTDICVLTQLLSTHLNDENLEVTLKGKTNSEALQQFCEWIPNLTDNVQLILSFVNMEITRNAMILLENNSKKITEVNYIKCDGLTAEHESIMNDDLDVGINIRNQ